MAPITWPRSRRRQKNTPGTTARSGRSPRGNRWCPCAAGSFCRDGLINQENNADDAPTPARGSRRGRGQTECSTCGTRRLLTAPAVLAATQESRTASPRKPAHRRDRAGISPEDVHAGAQDLRLSTRRFSRLLPPPFPLTDAGDRGMGSSSACMTVSEVSGRGARPGRGEPRPGWSGRRAVHHAADR